MLHGWHGADLAGFELVGQEHVELGNVDELDAEFVAKGHDGRDLVVVADVEGIVDEVDVVEADERRDFAQGAVEGARRRAGVRRTGPVRGCRRRR